MFRPKQEIAISREDLREGLTTMKELTTEISFSLQETIETSQRISENLDRISDGIHQLLRSVRTLNQDVGDIVQRTEAGLRKIEDSVRETKELTNGLDEHLEESSAMHQQQGRNVEIVKEGLLAKL